MNSFSQTKKANAETSAEVEAEKGNWFELHPEFW